MGSAVEMGQLFGAVVAIFLLSRLALFLLKKLGDNEKRIFIALGVTYVVAVVLGGLGAADGGPPQFMESAITYMAPVVLWLVVDLVRLRRRRAKAASAAV